MTQGLLGIALLGVVLAAPAATAQTTARSPVDLSGVWVLNTDLGSAEDTTGPDDVMDRGGPGRRGPGRGGPGMGGGGGGRRGPGGMGGPGRGGRREGGGSRPSDEEMQRLRALMEEVRELPSRVTIVQDGDLITFTDASGHVRTYAANGKTEKHQLTAGTIETKTRWESDTLVMDIKAGARLTITRTYALDPDERRLSVTTTLMRGRLTRTSVYEEAISD